MSLLIGLESANNPDGLLRPLRLLPGLRERRLAGTMLDWALRRLGVEGETAEEMKRMASLDEFHSQLEERAQGWTEQWFAEGHAEGMEQGMERGRAEGVAEGRAEGVAEGRAEGVAAQRAMLRRQAALRFGDAARLLDAHLEGVGSSAKLAEISEWLMVETIDRLIAKVEAAAAGHHVD